MSLGNGSDGGLSNARSRALRSIGAVREHGGSFYLDYLGVRYSLARDGVCEAKMEVDTVSLGRLGCIAPGALATLADIALGVTLQPFVDHRRLATFGLTIHTVRDLRTGSLHCRAEPASVVENIGVSRCSVSDEHGELLALATGAFAMLPVPESIPWRTYTRDSAAVLTPASAVDMHDLDGNQLELLFHAERASAAGGTDGPYADYLGIEWQSRADGQALGIWPLGSHFWNRTGYVHGGAVFGALAVAATACLPVDAHVRIAEQNVQFERPGKDGTLRLEARLLRRGQQLSSVLASATGTDGRSFATALVTLEHASDAE